MQPRNMNWVIAGKRYRTDEATLIAHDAYWNNCNWEQNGRNTFLFRTSRGNFFAQHQTQVPGESDSIKPLDLTEAMHLYQSLQKKEVPFVIVFPSAVLAEQA
jgi:hypothetical protein